MGSYAPLEGIYLLADGTDQTTEIQAALDAASPDEVVRLVGEFNISSTVVVKGNLDASGAVFTYTGPGLAVQIGAGGPGVRIDREAVILPRIVCGTKPATGWTAGTEGVRLVNANTCQIVVPHVKGFAVGLTTYGQGQGSAYNEVAIGHLENTRSTSYSTQTRPDGPTRTSSGVAGSPTSPGKA